MKNKLEEYFFVDMIWAISLTNDDRLIEVVLTLLVSERTSFFSHLNEEVGGSWVFYFSFDLLEFDDCDDFDSLSSLSSFITD